MTLSLFVFVYILLVYCRRAPIFLCVHGCVAFLISFRLAGVQECLATPSNRSLLRLTAYYPDLAVATEPRSIAYHVCPLANLAVAS